MIQNRKSIFPGKYLEKWHVCSMKLFGIRESFSFLSKGVKNYLKFLSPKTRCAKVMLKVNDNSAPKMVLVCEKGARVIAHLSSRSLLHAGFLHAGFFSHSPFPLWGSLTAYQSVKNWKQTEYFGNWNYSEAYTRIYIRKPI